MTNRTGEPKLLSLVTLADIPHPQSMQQHFISEGLNTKCSLNFRHSKLYHSRSEEEAGIPENTSAGRGRQDSLAEETS